MHDAGIEGLNLALTTDFSSRYYSCNTFCSIINPDRGMNRSCRAPLTPAPALSVAALFRWFLITIFHNHTYFLFWGGETPQRTFKVFSTMRLGWLVVTPSRRLNKKKNCVARSPLIGEGGHKVSG